MAVYTELEKRNESTVVRVAPARGAHVTSISVGGVELLFMDRATFEDPAKNVRGGIPLLFPFCGGLKDGLLLEAGTRIGQHGFARQKEWRVVDEGRTEIVLSLDEDATTRALFPWAFHLTYTVRALPRGGEVILRAENLSDKPMPVSPGWHPYFPLAVESKPAFQTDAPGAGRGCVTNDREINYGVVSPAGGRVTMDLPGTGRVRIVYTETMRHVQVWSPVGAPFVCVEPFDGAPDTINTPAAPRVPPQGDLEWRMAIELL